MGGKKTDDQNVTKVPIGLLIVFALISFIFLTVEPGWTSLIVSIWFLGGVQLISIGLIGEYIGKIYMEVKGRPRYNIDKYTE